MKLLDWAIGVTAAPRQDRTLDRTLTSLELAGFRIPRIFSDGLLELPADIPSSIRRPSIGGWPNFWLGLTELVAREPEADAYLMVQDDVVFCRNTLSYLQRTNFPDDIGLISLFTPSCNDGPFGWHNFPLGYGMAGAQALAFSRQRAYEFLAHPWTVNHRRTSPKTTHFRGDGLHHIDGVVGEWCRLVGRIGLCHTPSLACHIGLHSAMYPGFTGKVDRRFDDSFPGEQLDICETIHHFVDRLKHWRNHGGTTEYSISGTLWSTIAANVKPGMRTLELGSGLSTQLFLDAGCRHTALEHNPVWRARLLEAFPECAPIVVHAPLGGEPLWYNWAADAAPYDLVLVDGPPGDVGRSGIVTRIAPWVGDSTIVVVDDTNRPQDETVARELAQTLGKPLRRSRAGHHGFTIIGSHHP